MLNSTSSPAFASGCALLSPRILLYYACLCAIVVLMLTLSDRRPAIASQPAITIKMLDMPPVFAPASVVIKVGDSVTWQNVGNEVHHATSDPSMAIKSSEVGNPAGAEPFDSGFMKPGDSYTHTFTVPGTYKYACAVHETKGMIGEIVVK